MYTRDDAYAVLTEFTRSESLIKHALAVEAAMRAYARKFGEDEEKWAIVGLLHDFDYEIHPDMERHPIKGGEILRQRGWPEEIIRACMSHAPYTGIKRESNMEKAIFACDELCGFLVACALVRPSRSFDDMEVKSVRKKLKDKAFARTVNREEVYQAAAEFNVDLDEHIEFLIQSLRPIQEQLGLRKISDMQQTA